ncbi:garp complex component [Fusarium austroafricanum]|uniref:Garp complex component n=1 Tax=Fusarium austroafricanum TaxID=2364996 RepID=A0A8H4KED5_9HYPO|nr:garp complex component [Fusarium austroafricanum]
MVIHIVLQHDYLLTKPCSNRDPPAASDSSNWSPSTYHIDASEFKACMSQLVPLYEHLRRLKESEDEARPGPKSDNATRQGSGSLSRKGHFLSIVPDTYFDDNFHLENPRTFDVVSERSEIVPPASGATATSKPLATNAILQEKLSWYMDTVEVDLINSITMASTAFFVALGSLKELHLEAAESVEKIAALRKDLASLGGNVLNLIVDGVARCKSLVEDGDVEMALEEIGTVELLMAGERAERSEDEISTQIQLRDIRGAAAVQGMVNELRLLRSQAGKVYECKVHALLIGDLQRHVQSVSTGEVLLRWEAASLRVKGSGAQKPPALPSYMSQTSELRAALLPVIAGLHRSGSISTVMEAYRESVLREIRNLVRKPLPSSTDDAESVTSVLTLGADRSRTEYEKSFILARNLRALDADDAEKLFTTIFTSVAETLRRLKTQSSLLLDVACAVGDPTAEDPVKSPKIRSPLSSPTPIENVSMFEIQEEMHAALDLPNLLGQAVDVSHEKINKILQVRTKQTTGLPLAYFLRYYTLNFVFVNECEAISGRAGSSLKTIINGHIQDFVKAHSDRENQALAQGMGADTWHDKDFTIQDNEILKQILECGTSDPPAWTKTSHIWAPLPQEGSENVHDIDDSTAKDKAQGAIIDGETFLLPYSAILCQEGISRFLHLICGIPTMTSTIATSLVSYLQLFDSRCRQLILGTGALRSAGLKNITTTHLALALRALSFMSALTPHIRQFVKRHAPAGPDSANVMGEFDKIHHSFQEHQDGIYQKLVEIMASRASLRSEKARQTDWSKESVENVRKYMADLTRDTNKLYKALSKHLPREDVQLVMLPVFASYKDHFGTAFKEADPKTETGRDCMLYDVNHFIDKLCRVEGFDDLGAYLVEIIKSKEVQEDAAPEPTGEAT